MTYEEATERIKCILKNNSFTRADKNALKLAIEALEKQATVDAVPVVRCRDCRHLYDGIDDYCCMNHKGLAKICENSFCSYGERKDSDKR